MIAQAATLALALPILGALALDVRATLRNTRWQQRRRRILAERWSRDDAAYHAALAAVPAQGELHDFARRIARATFHNYRPTDGYSVKVK